jgi:hypothetical protein
LAPRPSIRGLQSGTVRSPDPASGDVKPRTIAEGTAPVRCGDNGLLDAPEAYVGTLHGYRGRMRTQDLLLESYGRIDQTLRRVLDGLDADQLATRVTPDANPIGWLAWHLLRVQDDHVAEVAGSEQVWTADGWARRFDLPVDDSATGYGFGSEQVAQVRVRSVDFLLGYADAVHRRTVEYLRTLGDDDLDRVVDDSWDPPVTLGVRLVSVLSDDLQHVGQAAYVRGCLGD